MAILAGDGLLTEAFALLAREPADGEPALLGAADADASARSRAAAGALGMVGGQAIDLAAAEAAARDGRRRRDFGLDAPARDAREEDRARSSARPRSAGAIMAGGDAGGASRAIAEYASALGLAFQIVDDILDVEGATEDLGKTAGKDAAAGKPTYPALVGLERSRALAARGRRRARARARHRAGRLHEIAGAGSRRRSAATWVGRIAATRRRSVGRRRSRCRPRLTNEDVRTRLDLLSPSAAWRRRASGRAP